MVSQSGHYFLKVYKNEIWLVLPIHVSPFLQEMKLQTVLFQLSFSTNQNVCLVCGAKEAHVRE